MLLNHCNKSGSRCCARPCWLSETQKGRKAKDLKLDLAFFTCIAQSTKLEDELLIKILTQRGQNRQGGAVGKRGKGVVNGGFLASFLSFVWIRKKIDFGRFEWKDAKQMELLGLFGGFAISDHYQKNIFFLLSRWKQKKVENPRKGWEVIDVLNGFFGEVIRGLSTIKLSVLVRYSSRLHSS